MVVYKFMQYLELCLPCPVMKMTIALLNREAGRYFQHFTEYCE